MKKLILFLSGVFLYPTLSSAQCPNSSFNAPGVTCAGQPINFTNTSTGAVSYKWDFCAGDLDSLAPFSIYDTAIVDLTDPVCATPVIEGINHYAFICDYNGASSNIVRVDFGNSFSTTPLQVTNLGNPFNLLGGMWGIAFIKESGIWYALITNIDASQVVKLDFSNGIDQPPTAGSVIVSTNLNSPRGLDIATDSAGNVFAAVTNYTGTSLTILSFGNSINNAVSVGSPISIASGAGAIGVSLAHECGNWCAFVACYSGGGVSRLDFGNSFLNTPVNNPLNLTLNNPTGLSVVNENGKWTACVLNSNGTYAFLHKSLIGNSLSNNAPTFESSDYLGVQYPQNIELMNDNSNWFGFTVSSLNTFQRISFDNSCNVNTVVSDSANPTNIIYNKEGVYNVSLVATDNNGNSSYSSGLVTIIASPKIAFSIQNVCLNDTTFFADSSTIAAGVIVSSHWDFGDGNTSNLPNPKHVYASTGTYTVSLTDSSDTGCPSVKIVVVNINPKPSANYSASFPVCPNIPIQFTDLSTISAGSITQWHWDFGNADTSALENPAYPYPTGGSYNATLTVTSDSGCSASHPMNIAIYDAPQSGFKVRNTCIGGTVNFTDTSTIHSGSINSWHWDFGDSNTSSTPSPSHPYAASVSTYSVSLLVQSVNGCKDSITRSVKINNAPTSSFSFAPAVVCQGNAIQFTDGSSVTADTIYAWHWDFGDGDSALIKNPLHAFATSGSYSVVLTAYSQTSCASSSSQPISVVQSPAAGFTFNSTCLGDSTYFTDNSLPAFGTTLSKWHWNFGGGSSDTSTVVSPVHHFSSSGNHIVTLTVTDNIGCNNVFSSTVAVHALPVAAFTTNMPCTSSPFQFFDASTSTDGAINLYSWNFGDPASGSNNVSNSPGPAHTYRNAGPYTVYMLITSVYGCSDEMDSTIDIIQASSANFQYLPTCEQHQMVFTNLDTIPEIDSTWNWSFGDGQGSPIASPSHYYLTSGTYNVTLTVTSMGGCVSTITKPVEVSPNPIADFVQAPVCLNTLFSPLNSSHVNSGSITSWQWTFGNGDSSSDQMPSVMYTDTGDYTVNLVVGTAQGCQATVTYTIHVYPLPSASFNYYPLFGNPPLLITFNDLSQNAAVYLWHFGDGDSSILSSPSHTYLDTGKFNATQMVYSNEGCIDSLTRIIYVIQPRLDIAVTGISYHLQNNLFSISAQVANLGTRDISNYYMEASLQNGATIDEYVQTPLPSGAQGIAAYNFTASFQVSAEQNINYYCVRAVSPDGETDDVPFNNEKCATVTNNFSVALPSPNPFSDRLQLQFILPYKGSIAAEIFNNIGKKIGTLYDGDASAGGTTLDINTTTFESGIYFCRFTFREQTLVFPVVKLESQK